MKKVMLSALLCIWGMVLHAQVKVFSRYNYYLAEKEGSIICILPDQGNYKLNLSLGSDKIETTAKAEGQRLSSRFNLDVLPIGNTTLHYVLEKENATVQKGDISITKLAPKANAVQIDQLTGGLIADGLPFFPFGFYCVPVGDLPEREVTHGFNMIGVYQENLPEGMAERRAYMDRCAQVGVKVQYGVNSLVGSGHNGDKGLDKTEQEKLALLKSEVLAFRDHPALLSYYINDEPDGQGRPPAVLEAAYQLIRELDPYHPVSIVFMMPQKANDFRNTMDIAMTDPYPIPGPADKVMDDLTQYAKAYQYEKSVWLVPQAFGGQEMWNREPTGAEIRLMTYMGLIGGAKGIQYYVHAPGNLNPQSVSAWSSASNVAVETAQMTSFLLSADQAPALHADDPKILTKAFSYQGNTLLIAVNNENKPKAYTLTTEMHKNANVECWFENREVAMENGVVHDIIDAYGTRVYLIRGNNPSAIPADNMTLNPGFEKIVSPGLPIGSNVSSTSHRKADVGASFFADPREHAEGMFSLRLITPVDSGGNKIRLVPMVMTKGNSYTVSIRAKAKAQEHMPSFRIAVDAMEQDHTFTLTSEWKEYNFTFQAPVSSTTAILSLELIQQGTAWFDVLTASPDPVITYKINADHTATVQINTNSNKEIRYAVNQLPDGQSALYTQAFPVHVAGMISAGIFEHGRQIAGSGIFVPVNLALGKKVSIAQAYAPQYAAHGDSTLTDGIMGTTAFKCGKWLGFGGKDLDATVDMETVTPTKRVIASFLCDPNSGIFLPKEVAVYTSKDGKNYKLAGKVYNNKNVRGEPYLQRFSIPVKGSARYIRVTGKAFGAIPEGYLFVGSTSWLFTDEILVQ
ncbi:carbohydrate binding domain-containing protein [Chitinophaga sancti]|uniref:Carbohydrate binding domain-containing protein n=1 Tax=Chitinophaga sancti TaxID=1004 RepID=A0A1K1S713_9BACT|nr:carbohydrate binding domain-containing protein [Chitinophaga sancti]WQD62217.1 carbohydrate binding domain-containing protein [Chitinophaga sancti]WQG92214.1 carbohydrate binding domain-containing protein [Chitinophaga sancti]SFW79860.1 Carbohydrate binding domain-containing protein [Chitinophaga sancti]